jgi:hypothetical protein
MDIQTAAPATIAAAPPAVTGSVSAVSWAAIFAGAAVASAVSLLLFVLATGLDLASLPFVLRRHTAASLTVMAAITLIVTQWIASGVGGYITGRLRTRWTGLHTHEVFFRDTAHGLITWAVATLFMALGLSSAANSLMGAQLTGFGRPSLAMAQGTQAPAAHSRTIVVITPQAAAAQSADDASEDNASDGLQLVAPTQKAHYVGTQLTAAQDSGERAGDDSSQQPGSDRERKDAALSSVLTALSMLIGAFIACVAAALGGHLRDMHA